MTTGIREYTNARFQEFLPQLPTLGGTAFRKAVMDGVIEKFTISVASAATHYNHSLKLARASTPEAVKGLGRPEDKKGGRKPIHTVDVIKVKTGEVVASGISKAKADEMIKAAADKKKAKLAIKEKEAEAAPAGTVDTGAVDGAKTEDTGVQATTETATA